MQDIKIAIVRSSQKALASACERYSTGVKVLPTPDVGICVSNAGLVAGVCAVSAPRHGKYRRADGAKERNC